MNQDSKNNTKRADVKNILIVDDEPDNLFLIKTYLKKENVNLVLANSGKEGVEFAKDQKFDFIFMDLNMPDLNGIESAKLIRSKSKSSESYIIALSAFNRNEISFTHLFNDFVGKPLAKKELLSKLSLSLTR